MKLIIGSIAAVSLFLVVRLFAYIVERSLDYDRDNEFKKY